MVSPYIFGSRNRPGIVTLPGEPLKKPINGRKRLSPLLKRVHASSSSGQLLERMPRLFTLGMFE